MIFSEIGGVSKCIDTHRGKIIAGPVGATPKCPKSTSSLSFVTSTINLSVTAVPALVTLGVVARRKLVVSGLSYRRVLPADWCHSPAALAFSKRLKTLSYWLIFVGFAVPNRRRGVLTGGGIAKLSLLPIVLCD